MNGEWNWFEIWQFLENQCLTSLGFCGVTIYSHLFLVFLQIFDLSAKCVCCSCLPVGRPVNPRMRGRVANLLILAHTCHWASSFSDCWQMQYWSAKGRKLQCTGIRGGLDGALCISFFLCLPACALSNNIYPSFLFLLCCKEQKGAARNPCPHTCYCTGGLYGVREALC